MVTLSQPKKFELSVNRQLFSNCGQSHHHHFIARQTIQPLVLVIFMRRKEPVAEHQFAPRANSEHTVGRVMQGVEHEAVIQKKFAVTAQRNACPVH